MKIALITGITGQDGSYLAELLLDKKCIIQTLSLSKKSESDNTVKFLFKTNSINFSIFVFLKGGSKKIR